MKSGIFSAMTTFLKKDISSYEKESLTKKRYQEAFKHKVSSKFIPSNIEELAKMLKKSKVAYVADFHTFEQNSKNFLKLASIMYRYQKNFIIALEMIKIEDQNILNDFLKDKISETTFLKKIDYQHSWAFPWSYYLPIFEFAKSHRLEIVALNSEGNLKERDLVAARVIKSQLKANRSMMVLFGELHLVKLPKIVNEKDSLIIHQNLDEIYFKLQKMNLQNGIYKFNSKEFILMTSAPWIKYEGQIYWYETLMDQNQIDLTVPYVKGLQGSSLENFALISRGLIDQLNLPLNKRNIENFNLYDFYNIDFLLQTLSKERKGIYQNYFNQIKNNHHFKIPFRSSYYCPVYTLSRLAMLAGWHLFDSYRLRQDIDYERKLFKSNVDIFLYYTYGFAFSYFASKLVNPYLKCDMYQDFTDKIIFQILDNNDTQGIKGKTIYYLYEIAKKIGSLLGDLIYLRFNDKKEFYRQELLNYPINLSNFYLLKDKIFKSIDYRQTKKQFF